MKSVPTTGVSIKLPSDLVQAVDRLAEAEERSRANMICVLLRVALPTRQKTDEQ
jgi:predicted transcriptional regulator